MATIRVSGTVRSPVERVWLVFTDIANAPARASGIDSVEILTAQAFGPGFRWRETRRMFGRSTTEEMWVTLAEEPTHYEVEAASRGTRYRSRFDFAPTDDGTRVDHTFTGTPTSTAAKAVDLLLTFVPKSLFAKALQQDLDELARACEDV